MSGGTLIIVFVLFVVSVAAIGMPFARASMGVTEAQKQRDTLLNAYERVLGVIRDLDDDYNAGKLSRAEYSANRERWAAEGVQLLQQLEHFGIEPSAKAKHDSPDAAQRALDDAVEEAISKYAKAISGGGR